MDRRVRQGIASCLAALVLYSCGGALRASAEPGRWTPVPLKSTVAFDATHPFGDFSGRAEELMGEIVMDPSDLAQAVRGTVTIDVRAITTGLNGRDRDLRRSLDAERHRQVRYAVQGIEASFASLSDRSDVTLTIRGTLTVRGVEQPLPLSGRARWRDDRVWVRGEGRLRLTDFGIQPPRRLFLTVGNQVAIRFDMLFQRASR
jgi:polyisoprenoid-binding protein YceI